MRITSIHINSKHEVSLKYEDQNATTKNWDSQSLDSTEPPLPAFEKALDALAGPVCAINEFPMTWAASIKVVGLGISLNKAGNRQLVIKAHRSLNQGGPLICTTPSEPMEVEDGSDGRTVGEKVCALVDMATAEAVRYIGGERAQAVIDLDGAGPAETAPTAAAGASARQLGAYAYKTGQNEMANEFDPVSQESAWREWTLGYREAEETATLAKAAAAKNVTPEPRAKGELDALAQGHKSWREGKEKATNPFNRSTWPRLADAWDEGWQEYQDAKDARVDDETAPPAAGTDNPSPIADAAKKKRGRPRKNAEIEGASAGDV